VSDIKKTTSFREYLQGQFKDNWEQEHRFYEDLLCTKLAYEIHKSRKQSGLTQSALARMIGTSQSALSRIERGIHEGYSVQLLARIGNALDLEFVPGKFVPKFHKEDRTDYVFETTKSHLASIKPSYSLDFETRKPEITFHACD